MDFLKEKNIKPGKRYPISCRVMYYMFLDWCESKNIKRAPIAYMSFVGLLKQKFQTKKGKDERMYFIINRNLRKDYLSPQREAAIERIYYGQEEKTTLTKGQD